MHYNTGLHSQSTSKQLTWLSSPTHNGWTVRRSETAALRSSSAPLARCTESPEAFVAALANSVGKCLSKNLILAIECEHMPVVKNS